MPPGTVTHSGGHTLQSPTASSRIYRFFSNVTHRNVAVPQIPPLSQPLALPVINNVNPIEGTDLTSVRPITFSDRRNSLPLLKTFQDGYRNVENEEVLRMVGTEHLTGVGNLISSCSTLDVTKATSLEPMNSMHHSSKFTISRIKDEDGNEIGEIVACKVKYCDFVKRCSSHLTSQLLPLRPSNNDMIT